MSRFSVESVFRAVDKFSAPVSRMRSNLGRFTRSAELGLRRTNRMLGKTSAVLKRTAVAAAASFAVMAAGVGNVLAAGADFEQAIVNVGAVSLQSRDQIQELEQMALQLGRTTKFTATQAANAMEVLAKAGFSTNDILTATPAVLDAAAASGLEIAEVADHVSNALKGMGLATSQAAHVSDVLALASSRTNSTIGSLGESIRNVAATARTLKVPFTEVTAAVALLQDVGLDASVAGSAFNTMLTEMAAPTSALQGKMRKMGIAFKDAKGDMLPFAQVVEQLNKAGKKAGGNFDKVAFLAELVGLRGQKAAANLADLFETGRLEELTRQLEKAEGSAKKMADLRMDTVQGSMLLLGSAVDAVRVKIFGLNNGPLKDTIDKMTAWVTANEDVIATRVGEFIGDLIENLPTIVTWIKRIGVSLAVFYTFSAVVNTLVGVFTLLNLVMAMNPIGLMAIGIASVIGSLVLLIGYTEDLIGGFKKLPGVLQFILLPLRLVLEAVKAIKDGVVAMWNGVSSKIGFGQIAQGRGDQTQATINGGVVAMRNGVPSKTGFGQIAQGRGDQTQATINGGGPQVVSPSDRVARSIEERNTSSKSEVAITTDKGVKATPVGKLGSGVTLTPSGAF